MSIDSRVEDRGFWPQTGCAAMVFSCGEADEGGFWVGLGRKRVGSSVVRRQATERGSVEKGWKKDGRAAGARFL
jgi:hypothetical protein